MYPQHNLQQDGADNDSDEHVELSDRGIMKKPHHSHELTKKVRKLTEFSS
jgi:hypothetical protein